MWYSQYLLSQSVAVKSHSAKDVTLVSLTVFMCDIQLGSISVLWSILQPLCSKIVILKNGQSIKCVTNGLIVAQDYLWFYRVELILIITSSSCYRLESQGQVQSRTSGPRLTLSPYLWQPLRLQGGNYACWKPYLCRRNSLRTGSVFRECPLYSDVQIIQVKIISRHG